ncbi:MAG TPA: hypothetical protein VFN03_04520, partial [Trueperaceae bacterium]|nr:hypothetical protein [Trueperaceae bacterium]
ARQVFVVPGRPDDPRYRGNLALLRDGAEVFTETSDVLLAFGIATGVSTDDTSRGGVAGAGARAAVPWSSPLPSIELGPLAVPVRRELNLDAEVSLDHLLERLSGPRSGVPGATVVRVSAGDLTALLTAMELTGEVERTAGGRYRLRRITATDP